MPGIKTELKSQEFQIVQFISEDKEDYQGDEKKDTLTSTLKCFKKKEKRKTRQCGIRPFVKHLIFHISQKESSIIKKESSGNSKPLFSISHFPGFVFQKTVRQSQPVYKTNQITKPNNQKPSTIKSNSFKKQSSPLIQGKKSLRKILRNLTETTPLYHK